MIVVERIDLRAVSGVIEAVVGCRLRKMSLSVIDKELVSAHIRSQGTRIADIDVEKSVIIDIKHGTAGRPALFSGNSG